MMHIVQKQVQKTDTVQVSHGSKFAMSTVELKGSKWAEAKLPSQLLINTIPWHVKFIIIIIIEIVHKVHKLWISFWFRNNSALLLTISYIFNFLLLIFTLFRFHIIGSDSW